MSTQFICQKCGKTYKHRQSYDKHRKYLCNDNAPVIIYSGCDKTFSRKDVLTKHIKICNGNSPIIPQTGNQIMCSFGGWQIMNQNFNKKLFVSKLCQPRNFYLCCICD